MTRRPVVARDIMVTRLVTLRLGIDVFEAIDVLLRNRISGAPVVDENEQYVGVFSERCSISLLLAAAYDGAPTNKIDQFIDRQNETITPETDLLTIAQTFLGTLYRRLPVLEEGRLIGQVSRRDVLRAAHSLLDMGVTEGSSVLYLSGLDQPTDSSILVRGRS